jgi:hypothetical protein
MMHWYIVYFMRREGKEAHFWRAATQAESAVQAAQTGFQVAFGYRPDNPTKVLDTGRKANK